jgi:hypothetical protein
MVVSSLLPLQLAMRFFAFCFPHDVLFSLSIETAKVSARDSPLAGQA